jgi:hypothetical protein
MYEKQSFRKYLLSQLFGFKQSYIDQYFSIAPRYSYDFEYNYEVAWITFFEKSIMIQLNAVELNSKEKNIEKKYEDL